MKLYACTAIFGSLFATQNADAFSLAGRSKVLNDLKEMRMSAGGAAAPDTYVEGEPDTTIRWATSSPVTWNRTMVTFVLMDSNLCDGLLIFVTSHGLI